MSGNDQPEPSVKSLSRERKRKELVVIEYELNEIVDKKLKKAQKPVMANPDRSEIVHVEEKDGIHLLGLECSVGTYLKNKTLGLYPSFKSANINEQTIISLGLNSIISLSYNYPKGQSTLFDYASQWRDLQSLFPTQKYNINQYDNIKSILAPVISSYKAGKSSSFNWLVIFRKIKALQVTYNIEANEEHEEENFCLFFIESVMNLQKYHPYLFEDNVKISEWDYICKLWAPVMERLFICSGLRLTWGETKLSIDDTDAKYDLKVDLRTLHDETVQRYSKEIDTSVLESAKGGPNVQKYQSNHYKLMIKCKTIIDTYIINGFDVDDIDFVQICGLDIVISNLRLSAPGLYIGNERFYGSVTRCDI
ncbi:hypothetical protein BDF21DRAFT_455659 [Thamnidium elegans]|nr:hypothetical protein BDF21DRAFT_455659 [Thamnidium elegans]